MNYRMQMKRIFFAIAILLISLPLLSRDIAYTVEDSTKVTAMLRALKRTKCNDMGTLLLHSAQQFLGTEYVGGTLDREQKERLTVNVTEVDCTTFVELALAMALTVRDGKCDFATFCDNLRFIRYRGGVCSAYADRLHYFSQWVGDGCKKNIMKEINGKAFSGKQHLVLDFMSRNYDKYPQLKSDTALVKAIAEHEKPFCGIAVPYIPKAALGGGKGRLPIRNGDIIALVTTIKGLDVTHLGFAVWQSGRLHLLHASSKEKKVVLDKMTLHDYLAPRKSCPGVRVVRVK